MDWCLMVYKARIWLANKLVDEFNKLDDYMTTATEIVLTADQF